MERVIDRESFIRVATEIHKNKYDYSRVVYIKSYEKVEIICPIHGSFWQRAESHLWGSGCGHCHIKIGRINRGLLISREIPTDPKEKRKCSKCGQMLDRTCFYTKKKNKDKLDSICKACSYKGQKEWEKKNIDVILVKRKKRSKEIWAKYKMDNAEEIETRRREREIKNKERREEGKIARGLKKRMGYALKMSVDNEFVMSFLGCSIKEFRGYISSKFTEGMSWDNWGAGEDRWHLDHIRPCASFNLKDIGEQQACFHYTNYQPLWERENHRKGSIYNGVRYGAHH